jgi:hypothetical protein
MKIDLNTIDRDQFIVQPNFVGEELCHLVFPQHIGAKWSKSNLHFRSSLWNSEGELISAGFKKFFNYGEQPNLAYTPFSLTANGGVNFMEKLDGSTLIVSKYKGELIVRTRGSMHPENMDKAGHEIEILKDKYPVVFGEREEDIALFGPIDTWGFSYVYEWVSPANKIVINHTEPDLYLLAIIDHIGYTYAPQSRVDVVAKAWGVKRPRRFEFDTFDSMFAAIHALDYSETTRKKSPQEVLTETRAKEQSELTRDFEGFCVYCNKDQDIRKVKSAWYLAMHKLKSELSSIDKVVDLWATLDYPEYQSFINYIEEKFDWEIAQMVRGFASRICEGKKEVDKIVESMHRFVEPLKTKSRKEAALSIQSAYGETNRGGYCFQILDGKTPLNRDSYKKLLYQVLKR